MTVQIRARKRENKLDVDRQAAIRDVAAVLRPPFGLSTIKLRMARKSVGTEPHRPQKRLPDHLTDTERAAFFVPIEQQGNAKHDLLFRLLYIMGLRVPELVDLKREHLNVPNCPPRV